MAAVGQMLFDRLPQFGGDVAVDVAGNLFPDVLAVQNHDPPALPLNNPNTPLLFDASCGARIFCIMRRARSKRVFTTPGLTPSASDVSAMLTSSTSRSSSTWR